MKLWDILKPNDNSIDINVAVERLQAEEGAVLLDVRDPHEYVLGHVPGSVNLPLSEIQQVEFKAPNAALPVFVYCQSGMRSSTACRYLRSMGYREVKNAGSISKFDGELVTGKAEGALPRKEDAVAIKEEAAPKEDAASIPWEDGAAISVKSENGQTVIAANPAGLRSLAKQMLELAEKESGNHIHYDEGNSLEEGSEELVIEVVQETCGASVK